MSFGTRFAGRQVRLRFRVGTDAAVGDEGWEIDDIEVVGITNLPFGSIIDDSQLCDDAEGDLGPEQPTAGCSSSRGPVGGSWLAVIAVLLALARRRGR
jgi:hypothetical protein